MPMIVLAGAATLFASVQAAHTHHHHGHDSKIDQLYRECLCWNNTSDNFCLGDDWSTTDQCQNLQIRASAGAMLLFVAFAIMIVFPCCFYLARWACNCCGGRYSTSGCCCSDVSSRATHPGYRNWSIVLTKVVFFVISIATACVAIAVLSANGHLHSSMKSASTYIVTAVHAVAEEVVHGLKSVETLADRRLASKKLVDVLQHAATGLRNFDDDVHRVAGHVHRAESRFREPFTYIVPASGLLGLLTMQVLAVTNLRKLVGILVIGMCMHVATTAALAVPQDLASVGLDLICNNYDETSAPLVVGQAKAHGLCENAVVASGIAETSQNARLFFTAADGEFCSNWKSYCEAAPSCRATPCEDYQTYSKSVEHQILPTDAKQALTMIRELLAASQSYAGSSTKALQAVEALRGLRPVVADLNAVLVDLHQFNHDCGTMRAALHGPLRSELCGHDGLDRRFRSVAHLLGASVLLGFVCVFAAILGMKRFRALGSYDPYRGTSLSESAAIMDGAAANERVVLAALCETENSAAVSGVLVKEVQYVADAPQNVQQANYGAAGTGEYRRV